MQRLLVVLQGKCHLVLSHEAAAQGQVCLTEQIGVNTIQSDVPLNILIVIAF